MTTRTPKMNTESADNKKPIPTIYTSSPISKTYTDEEIIKMAEQIDFLIDYAEKKRKAGRRTDEN